MRRLIAASLLLAGCYDFAQLDVIPDGAASDATSDRGSADQRGASDGSLADRATAGDAGPPSDLSTLPDLGVPADLAAPDLAAPDLAAPPDASVQSDLSVPSDLVTMPDQVVVAKMLAFQPRTTMLAGAAPMAIASGDFNQDGKPDVAAALFGPNGIGVFRGHGDGAFDAVVVQVATVGHNQSAIVAVDLNGDGLLDLATANTAINNTGGVSVFLGDLNAKGTFKPSVEYGIAATLVSIAAGDLTKDGKPELVASNSGNVMVFINSGTGTFNTINSAAAGTKPYGVAIGDLDGKQLGDIVAANQMSNDVTVQLGGGTGMFPNAGVPYAVGAGPYSVALGDMDGDGKPDVVAVSPTDRKVSVLLNTGTGAFKPAINTIFGVKPFSIALADFNLDGHLDVAVGDNEGINPTNIWVLLGQGDGSFKALDPFAAGIYPIGITAVDLNGDKLPDLVAVDGQNNGTLSVLINSSQ